ncbi:hypothetical protein [Burkholderia diffusa]|uniref:hypothetical protein n=1 Tax=Burkholderia diffusa TaxID=488732 RepID=UPI000A64E519|nr:hypothetical protein [Burkholderia diffusa]
MTFFRELHNYSLCFAALHAVSSSAPLGQKRGIALPITKMDPGTDRIVTDSTRRGVMRAIVPSAWAFPESYAKWHFVTTRITARYE